MSENQPLGITTGVKLGIGGCIGVVMVAAVVFLAVLGLLGFWLFDRRSTNGPLTNQGVSQPSTRPPTLAQLTAPYAPEQWASPNDDKMRLRVKGHQEASKTLPSGITSTLEGPDKTITLIRCVFCDQAWAKGFLDSLMETADTFEGVGLTHFVITNGYTTSIMILHNREVRYYQGGFVAE